MYKDLIGQTGQIDKRGKTNQTYIHTRQTRYQIDQKKSDRLYRSDGPDRKGRPERAKQVKKTRRTRQTRKTRYTHRTDKTG
jgi:hypothetical protein